MLLSPIKFFIFQIILMLLIMLGIFFIGKSCLKNRANPFVLFIKIITLALLGALLFFIVTTAISPNFTLSMMHDYWRLECVEEQIGHKQYQHQLTTCLGQHPTCARTVSCMQSTNTPETIAEQYLPSCDREGGYLPLQKNNAGYSWCVTKHGHKIPGTMRLPHQNPVACEVIAKEISR